MLLTCAICHETFEPGWSDEEAQAELRRNFGNLPLDQCVVVCDVCWRRRYRCKHCDGEIKLNTLHACGTGH